MTLLELQVDLARVADSLDRIVFLLEKLVFPPAPADVKVRQASLDDLHIVTPEDQARILEEQAAFAERYRVVPGSEAFGRALEDWEGQQRNLYGEAWQAPEDWKTIFAEAERSRRTGRAPAGSAADSTARG